MQGGHACSSNPSSAVSLEPCGSHGRMASCVRGAVRNPSFPFARWLHSRLCHVEKASQKEHSLGEMKMAALQCFWPVWQDAPADYLSRLYRTVNQFIEAADNFKGR